MAKNLGSLAHREPKFDRLEGRALLSVISSLDGYDSTPSFTPRNDLTPLSIQFMPPPGQSNFSTSFQVSTLLASDFGLGLGGLNQNANNPGVPNPSAGQADFQSLVAIAVQEVLALISTSAPPFPAVANTSFGSSTDGSGGMIHMMSASDASLSISPLSVGSTAPAPTFGGIDTGDVRAADLLDRPQPNELSMFRDKMDNLFRPDSDGISGSVFGDDPARSMPNPRLAMPSPMDSFRTALQSAISALLGTDNARLLSPGPDPSAMGARPFHDLMPADTEFDVFGSAPRATGGSDPMNLVARESISAMPVATSLPISLVQGILDHLTSNFGQALSVAGIPAKSVLLATTGVDSSSSTTPTAESEIAPKVEGDRVEMVEEDAPPTRGSDLFSWNSMNDSASLETALDDFLERLTGIDPQAVEKAHQGDELSWPAAWTVALVSLEVSRRWLGIGDSSASLRRRSKAKGGRSSNSFAKLAGWPGSWSSRFP